MPAETHVERSPMDRQQVFDLIQRDDRFYLQLIDPERGGELATIKAPVLLEDAKQLSATR